MRMPNRRLLPVLLSLVLLLGACGGGKKEPKTTDTSFEDTTSTLGDESLPSDLIDTSTTLAAMAIDITPAEGKPGTSFAFAIADFKPGEKVRFEISFPNAAKPPYTGPEHTIPTSGKLSVNYRVSTTDPTGEYTVKATGDKGSLAEGRFTVSGTAVRTTATTRAGATTTKKPASTTTTTRAGASTTATTSGSSTTSTTRSPTTSTTVATTTTTSTP